MKYPDIEFTRLSDKYLVREYVKEKIGEKYLVPLYKHCQKMDLAVLQSVPNSFVVKATHGAGFVRIVKDKSKEDLNDIIENVNSWLTDDFSRVTDEMHYKNINPTIIIEEALLNDGTPPADYKIHVFRKESHEKPYIFFQVIGGRFDELQQNFFLEDWMPAPFKRKGAVNLTDPGLLKKPECLNEMIHIAEKLSEPFGYCRVDLYIHRGSPFFGELTFTPSSGNYEFEPKEWDSILGEKFGSF